MNTSTRRISTPPSPVDAIACAIETLTGTKAETTLNAIDNAIGTAFLTVADTAETLANVPSRISSAARAFDATLTGGLDRLNTRLEGARAAAPVALRALSRRAGEVVSDAGDALLTSARRKLAGWFRAAADALSPLPTAPARLDAMTATARLANRPEMVMGENGPVLERLRQLTERARNAGAPTGADDDTVRLHPSMRPALPPIESSPRAGEPDAVTCAACPAVDAAPVPPLAVEAPAPTVWEKNGRWYTKNATGRTVRTKAPRA